jgi:hypothetical protein
VEDLFQPGKMEPVYRGSDIAAICFSVSAMVAVKKRGHRVLVRMLDSLFCRRMGMCAGHYCLAGNSTILGVCTYRVVRLSFKRSLRLEMLW